MCIIMYILCMFVMQYLRIAQRLRTVCTRFGGPVSACPSLTGLRSVWDGWLRPNRTNLRPNQFPNWLRLN